MVGKPLYSRVNVIYSELQDCLASKEIIVATCLKDSQFYFIEWSQLETDQDRKYIKAECKYLEMKHIMSPEDACVVCRAQFLQ
jgi:hypothetical protein